MWPFSKKQTIANPEIVESLTTIKDKCESLKGVLINITDAFTNIKDAYAKYKKNELEKLFNNLANDCDEIAELLKNTGIGAGKIEWAETFEAPIKHKINNGIGNFKSNNSDKAREEFVEAAITIEQMISKIEKNIQIYSDYSFKK